MKKYLIFNATVILLVILTLTWVHFSRTSDFRQYHHAIASESTASVSQSINSFINEKKRLVDIFAQEHIDIINQLAHSPENEQIHQQLKSRIALFFPEFFTFTIARRDGTPYLEDFDGLIGNLCLNDLKEYAQSDQQLIRIHPHPDVYHFDVSSKLHYQQQEFILFISFHADILGNILKNAQAPGHQLLLLYTDGSNLIEVTEQGSRINIPRNDYRLTTEEAARILVSHDIPNTRWKVSDLSETGLFTRYHSKLILSNLFILLVFLLVIFSMTFVIRREEKRRIEAEKHKDDFVSIINHELRTPITSIQGSLSLIANSVTGQVNEKTMEMVNIALSNSERLKLLINDLLDIKRFEEGNIDLNRKPVNLAELADNCIRANLGYASKHDVSFNLVKPKEEVIINADPDRTMQVISNLLSNAAKFGRKNDEIQIIIERTDGHGKLSVIDHGEGIPDNFKQRIFQKFSQSSVEHHKGGTGLGLNIVKMIVDAHGGKVGFDSQLGKETCFYFELPLFSVHY